MTDFSTRDEDTQNARIKALAGRNVIWVTAPVLPGMSEGMKKSIEWTIQNGVILTAVFGSQDDVIYKIMNCGTRKLFHHAVFADMNDDAQAGHNCVQSIRDTGLSYDGCFSPYEQCQTLVGEIAESLGLPGNPKSAYVKARSKHSARQALRDAGLNTPKSMEIFTEADIQKAAGMVGFPMIVKPQMGAGSAGVYKVTDEIDLTEKSREILAEAKDSWDLQWNPGLAGVAPVMVEQFLDGPEFDVDILMFDDKCVFTGVIDNWPPIPPIYLETGANLPSLFSDKMVSDLKEYGVGCVRALGFKYGCFHVECMYTKDGPMLIEVNPREGGGPIQEFYLDVYGVDLYANFFLSLCGIEINPPRSEEPLTSQVFYYVNCPKTGKLERNDFLEEAKKDPLVNVANYYFSEGDAVKGYDLYVPDWVAEIGMSLPWKGRDDLKNKCAHMQELIDRLTPNIKISETPKAPPRKASEASAIRRKSLHEI
eukprot:CFRG2773T1